MTQRFRRTESRASMLSRVRLCAALLLLTNRGVRARAAAKAAAAGDHRALSDYFARLAQRYRSDADGHTGMATLYRTGRTAAMSNRCERLARLARGAATEARTAAEMHKKLIASTK